MATLRRPPRNPRVSMSWQDPMSPLAGYFPDPGMTLQQRIGTLKRQLQSKMSMLDADEMGGGEIIFSDDVNDERSLIADLFKRPHQMGNNLTGLVILCIVLTVIAVIFFGCYLMMRFMHRALAVDDGKDTLGSVNPYNNVVMHSKRVYEIQAEEGCFTEPPDPLDPNSDFEDEKKDGKSQLSTSSVEDEEKKLKKPEQGDLRSFRGENFDDDPRAMIRKKQKVHKDSVCAFLFRPEPEPRMV